VNRRTEEIYDIIRYNPGATGATIDIKLRERSRAARWFGVHSVIAILLSPLACVYPHLAQLEHEGRIRSEWGLPTVSGHRRRHYFVNF
jgi:hypothetical protein